jgi:hypothetical protein
MTAKKYAKVMISYPIMKRKRKEETWSALKCKGAW